MKQVKALYNLLLILLCFVCFPAISQTNKTDSLLRIISQAKNDSIRAEIYYDLARNNYTKDTEKAMGWASLGALYYKKMGLIDRMTRCMNLEAVCLLILRKPNESVKMHYEILRIREEARDSIGLAETFLNIGNVFYRGCDHDQAVDFFHKSRNISLKHDIVKLLAATSNNIGLYHLDIYKLTKDRSQYYEAVKYLRESIKYKSRLLSDRSLEKTYLVLAKLYFEVGEVKKALSITKIAERLSLDYNNDEAVASAKLLLGEIDLFYGDKASAKKRVNELDHYVKKHKVYHIKEFHKFEIANLLERADKINALIDSVDVVDAQEIYLTRQKFREELKIKYETERTELENENLRLSNQVIKAESEKNRDISLLAITVGIALCVFLVILIRQKMNLKKSQLSISSQSELLKIQNQKLREAEIFKSKLFAIISHDLRSPLSTLKTTADVYYEIGLSQKDTSNLMKEIVNELNITYNLLEDLLAWSKRQMEEKQLEWRYISFCKTIEDNVEVFATQILNKKLKVILCVDEKSLVWADENCAEVIIRNLIQNAIKYSLLGGIIRIGLEDLGRSWQFYIQDEGVGMSKGAISGLLKSAKPQDSTTGTFNEKGFGLGLLLSQDCIERMNWTFDIKSKPKSGTTFFINIPKKYVDAERGKIS